MLAGVGRRSYVVTQPSCQPGGAGFKLRGGGGCLFCDTASSSDLGAAQGGVAADRKTALHFLTLFIPVNHLNCSAGRIKHYDATYKSCERRVKTENRPQHFLNYCISFIHTSKVLNNLQHKQTRPSELLLSTSSSIYIIIFFF